MTRPMYSGTLLANQLQAARNRRRSYGWRWFAWGAFTMAAILVPVFWWIAGKK